VLAHADVSDFAPREFLCAVQYYHSLQAFPFRDIPSSVLIPSETATSSLPIMNATAVPVCICRIPSRRPGSAGSRRCRPRRQRLTQSPMSWLTNPAPAPEPLGIERAGGDGSACSLPAALPPTVGRQLAMRRPAVRPEWRFNVSCLVKRSAGCWHLTRAVLAAPQNPGAATVEFSLTGGQDRDTGGRSSRHRRAQEASRCAS
jgi:hypothetical protein